MPLIVRDDPLTGVPQAARSARPAFAPSPQQRSFLRELSDGDGHVLLRARAGTGKSSTCRLGAWELADRGLRSTYACFNAHIAREFQIDLPSACRASTLHSLGLALLRKAGDVQVDEDKVDRILETYLDGREMFQARSAARKLVSLCKNLLADAFDDAGLEQLAADFDVEIPEQHRGDVLAIVPDVLEECRRRIATIDFDDMIWLPTVLDLRAARSPDVLFIDEAQDLNACQHALSGLLAPEGRMVIVGDDRQAIYAFRGADHRSIDSMRALLEEDGGIVAEYPLTVTRRCPRRHVELARRLVPDLDHLTDAPAGEIDEIEPEEYVGHCRPGDMVLCRTNAPLVSACYRLIRAGTPASVRGRDIGKGLLALIARLRCRMLPDLVRRIGDFRVAEIARLSGLRNPTNALQALNDKCACLLALCEGASSVEEVRERATTMFSDLNDANSVVLSSVHRAKGLERDHIVILRPDLMPGPWAETPADRLQEKNLVYVSITRSRSRLTFAGPIPAILQ